jgi:hypothetical protein
MSIPGDLVTTVGTAVAGAGIGSVFMYLIEKWRGRRNKWEFEHYSLVWGEQPTEAKIHHMRRSMTDVRVRYGRGAMPPPKPDSEASEPPRRGELLLLFALSRKDQDAIIGDLAERYGRIRIKYGPRWALIWYVWQVVATIASTLLARALKWKVLSWLTAVIHKLTQ